MEERDPITALLDFLEAAAIFTLWRKISMEERRRGKKGFFFSFFLFSLKAGFGSLVWQT